MGLAMGLSICTKQRYHSKGFTLMTTVNCQAIHGFLIKVVKPYSSKFLAMMADDRSNNKYASIWCKNETKSLIREDPVVNLRGRKQKS